MSDNIILEATVTNSKCAGQNMVEIEINDTCGRTFRHTAKTEFDLKFEIFNLLLDGKISLEK